MSNPWMWFKKPAVYADNPAAQWCRANPTDPRMPAIRDQIANVPQMLWLGPGSSKTWIAGYVANAVQQATLPQLVLYAIPNRDLGSYSAGGVATAADYRSFVDTVASAISTAPCIVLVEPDSLIQCLKQTDDFQRQRLGMLQYAVATINRVCPNAWVYLDAGDGFYSLVADLAPLLLYAGISFAQGFAVNVSNVNPTSMCLQYVISLNSALAKYGIPPKASLIDISRNGNGRPPQSYIDAHNDWWCNTPGSKLGARPAMTGQLWVKAPGVSDGKVGIVTGVPSGQFDPRLAMALINGAVTA